MTAQTFAKFKLNEWLTVQAKAKLIWIRSELGERPTRKAVKKALPNPHTITFLEWLAVIVLLVLTAFTSYKVGAVAVPFATETLNRLAQHTYISDPIRVSFIMVTALLFMLLATPSVIYFKLLSHEPEIKAEKKDTRQTRWFLRWTLDFITPRLPALVVYLSVCWLVVISAQLPGTVFEQYLPVVVEVALAMLVGNIMRKRRDFNKIVEDALKEQTDPYDRRLADYERDPAYLRILYQVMREEAINLRRSVNGKGNLKANAWLETADDAEVFNILSAEYRRLTIGNKFALAVSDGSNPVAIAAQAGSHTKRVPAMGDRQWTPETLTHDLKVRGIAEGSGYGEKQLAEDYEAGFGARAAWRGGAKNNF